MGLLFLTSALDGGEWSASLPGRFTPVKTHVHIGEEARWTPEPSGRCRVEGNSLYLPGVEL
jgi:hypothetical protein